MPSSTALGRPEVDVVHLALVVLKFVPARKAMVISLAPGCVAIEKRGSAVFLIVALQVAPFAAHDTTVGFQAVVFVVLFEACFVVCGRIR